MTSFTVIVHDNRIEIEELCSLRMISIKPKHFFVVFVMAFLMLVISACRASDDYPDLTNAPAQGETVLSDQDYQRLAAQRAEQGAAALQ